jgi:hypothetical protein
VPRNANPCGFAQVKISDKYMNQKLKLIFDNAIEYVYLIGKCSLLCLTYTSNLVVTKQLVYFMLVITVCLLPLLNV